MLIYHDLHTPTSTHTFRLYPVGTDFSRIGGIYCFLIVPGLSDQGDFSTTLEMTRDVLEMTGVVRQVHNDIGLYSLLYVGLTNNFDYRLKHHHKMSAALELGITHIGILKFRSGRKRKMVERDLLRSLNPPLNETFRV